MSTSVVNYSTDCIAECFFDKQLNTCGSCFRTLEQIAAVGIEKKRRENEVILARLKAASHQLVQRT